MKYIDADKLIAEIERLKKENDGIRCKANGAYCIGYNDAFYDLLSTIDSLSEQPEVDLEKLGEITRRLIAVKDHEEDMRLTNDEWLLLERIGYPERFNARKEDK